MFALAALLLALGSLPLISQLGLNSALTALLPDDKPSARDLEAIRGRLGGTSTLTLAIQSKDLDAMERFARDLVPKLEADRPDDLRSIEWNIGAYEEFVRKHRILYAKQADLEEVRDGLDERLQWERTSRNPLFVSLEDEEPEDPETIVQRIEERMEKKAKSARRPGGFYVHEDGDLLAVFLRTDIRGGDVEATRALEQWVRGRIEALQPKKYAPDLVVEFAGDLLHDQEEHDAIATELVLATNLAIVLVLFVIYLFFRRLSSIVLIGISLAVPTLVTFAIAELAVDYLNASTAFLGSIVVGNGINPNIIWLARYFEERRADHDHAAAVLATHRGTWIGTLTASAAAATAYASLIITDFRGFRDFGIIGGVGMLLCWLGAVLLLPALVTLYDRRRSLRPPQEQRRARYGELFARAVFAAPRTLAVGAWLLAAVTLALVVAAVINDPIEYDFRNLRSVREKSSRASTLNGRVKSIVGGAGAGQAIAIVVERPEDAVWLKGDLERRRDKEGAPYGRVRLLQDLLPSEQEAKLPLAKEIRKLLVDARGYADDEQQAKIDEHMPPEDLHVLTLADLPVEAARSFTERDGTRGRLVLVEQEKARSLWDGRYLVAWAKALRELRLPDGSRPPLAGRAPVFADMIEVVWVDGPKAVIASFLATLVLVSIAFRSAWQRLLSMMALLMGIAWMGGAMALLGMKLNFLNFVAFPITFGNGVDYGVNVMRRVGAETKVAGVSIEQAVRRAIEETGGAVTLCSLTTILGYGALHVSSNKALNSFATAMVISEVTCLLAAVIAMPAMLVWRERRRSARAA